MSENNNFIDLRNVPLKKKGKVTNYSWEDCNNTPAEFKYKNTEGTLYITFKCKKISGKKRLSLLTVKYRDLKQDMVSSMIIKCSFGGFLKYKTKDFYYNVGDVINNSKIIKRIRFDDTYGKTKGYEMLCLETNGIFRMRESNVKSGQKSPYLRGYKVGPGNSLFNDKTTLKYLKNKEDAHKFNKRSAKKIKVECKICGFEKEIRVVDLVDYGFTCPFCTKGISFPERYMASLLNINGITYEFQKTFPNLKRRRFDFYLPNQNCVIEMNGAQHYQENNFLDYQSTIKSDEVKKKYCEKHDINYIPINCSRSTFEFISEELKNSQLNEMLKINDKEEISNEMIKSFINENLREIIKDYKNGVSYKNIVEKYELRDKYELIGIIKKYGVYEYRSGSELTSKKVVCLNNTRIFDNIKEAAEYGGLKTSSHIVQVCKKKRKTSGKHPETGEPLRWMYYDEYTN